MDSNMQWLIDTLTNGESIENFTPKSRLEEYLKAALTRSGTDGLDIPRNRLDAFMYQLPEQTQKIYDQGMADSPAHAENALLRSIVDRSISGEFTTPDGWKFEYYSFANTKITKLTVTNTVGGLGGNGYTFANMKNLTEVDWYYGLSVGAGFAYCTSLETIRYHNRVQFVGSDCFMGCKALKNLVFGSTCKIINSVACNFTSCPLTVDSLLNILNACEDNTGGTTYTLKLGSTNLAKLTEEQKQIAYDKNIELI